MADYPILYVLQSALLNKPVYVVVADKEDVFYIFDYTSSTVPLDESSNYTGEARSMYNNPLIGRSHLPIGTRNELELFATVIKKATTAQIRYTLKQLQSVSKEDVHNALTEKRKEYDKKIN